MDFRASKTYILPSWFMGASDVVIYQCAAFIRHMRAGGCGLDEIQFSGLGGVVTAAGWFLSPLLVISKRRPVNRRRRASSQACM